jgi:hypothetical protein
MLKDIKLVILAVGLLGCKLPAKEIQHIDNDKDAFRLKVYENNLRICGYFFIFECGTKGKSAEERDRCLDLLDRCSLSAAASYKKDLSIGDRR